MTEDRNAKQKSKGGVLFFLAGFVVMLIIGWAVFPALLYSTSSQPVGFSHKKHIEAEGLDCEACHTYRDDGTFMGTANMVGDMEGACLNCHDDPDTPKGTDPREVHFLKEYVAKEVEHIEWKVYSKQPPCVFFPHSVHTVKAEIECLTCHGDMAQQDEPPLYKQNRLSGYSIDIWGRNISGATSNSWESMKMSDCGACHDEQGAPNGCQVCHK